MIRQHLQVDKIHKIIPKLSSRIEKRYEPAHDKIYKIAGAHSEHSDQPEHPPSDQSSLCAQWVAKDPSFLHADSQD